MKKVISIFLCVTVLLGLTLTFASALPLAAGDEALRDSFKSGSGGGLSYEYFTPECKYGIKYPLVIWLHGIASGNYDGDQVDSYDFCKWASDELQSRFTGAGGAFLLCPRAAGTWDLTSVATLKNCIDSFTVKFAGSIDTDRIYIIGFSIGATMTIKTAAAYPGYFAAAVPISAIDQTASSKLGNMSVWFFANEKDLYISANAKATMSTFDSLAASAADPSKIRITTVSQAVYPDTGAKVGTQHYMWRTVTNDMFMTDGSEYAYSTTKDGTGQTLHFTYPDGIISWLAAQTRTPVEEVGQKLSFFDKIINFFRNILNLIKSIFS